MLYAMLLNTVLAMTNYNKLKRESTYCPFLEKVVEALHTAHLALFQYRTSHVLHLLPSTPFFFNRKAPYPNHSISLNVWL